MIQENIQPRIYVACLAAYNAGELHGQWIACDDVNTMQESVTAMLAASPEPDAEEWAIHDYEGFGSLSLSEYQSLETMVTMAGFIQEHGPIGSALVDHFGEDIEAAREAMDEDYQGCFQSLEQYAEQFLEDTGALKDVPHTLRHYINCEALGRDMELNGDVFTITLGYQETHVFWNR